jgi:molybdenum cofactor biosynthesis enzyme MoaA
MTSTNAEQSPLPNPSVHSELKKVFCQIPFNEFHVYDGGMVANCCFDWLPKSIGNIHEHSFLELRDGLVAKQIQDSVRDGSYSFCSLQNCPHLSQHLSGQSPQWPLQKNENFDDLLQKQLSKSLKIYLSFDYSCNLFCASCRNEKIFFTRAQAPPALLKTYERVASEVKALVQQGYQLEINVTGSGDAFASPLSYEFMNELPKSDLVTLHLSTNGTMMTKSKLEGAFRKQIKKNFISVDACTKSTYEKVRRGGSFAQLEKNLVDFDQLVLEGFFPALDFWQLNYIVQQENYHEMADFVSWTRQFRTLNAIFFTRILDWKHLPAGRFEQKAIWMSSHPENQKFREILQQSCFNDSRVILGNLTEFRRG